MKQNPEELERYARQCVMPEIGEAGQEKLAESRVLVVGAGGLGSPAAFYLAAAGVGTIGIADGDVVACSNLQRQILHTTERIGMPKTASAQKTLSALNPHVHVVTHPFYLNEQNILSVIQSYDFVIDATDRMENKLLINDACVLAKKPFVHAGVLRAGGQIMTYVPEQGPCFRCIFEDMPEEKLPSCAQVGVLGMTAGIAGSAQAMEAVKYLLGTGELLVGKLLTFDGFSLQVRILPIPHRAPNCRVCSSNADIKSLAWYGKYRKSEAHHEVR